MSEEALFRLWIRGGRYQFKFLNLPTATSKHAGGAILSSYDSLQPSVFKFCLIYIENVKNCSASMQGVSLRPQTVASGAERSKLLKSLSKKPWGSSKEVLLIYYISMPGEGGENKIYQFRSFFSLLLKILTEAGRFIILWISSGGWVSWHRSNVSVLLALAVLLRIVKFTV